MVFNSTWATEPEVSKAAPEELAAQRSRPPIAGAYLAGGRTGTLPDRRPSRNRWPGPGQPLRPGRPGAERKRRSRRPPGHYTAHREETVTAHVVPAP